MVALTAVTVYPVAVGVVAHLFTLGCAGKSVKVTITEYRTANRYKSGQQKDRYKYWTNVLIKYGNIILLHVNDSVVYR